VLGGQGGNTGVIGSPLAFLIFLVAYTMIIVAAMNKCFEAIHIIPEKVMRWIGGQGEQYGESAAVGEMKRGTESAAAGITKAGETGQQGAFKAADQKGQVMKKEREGSGPSVG
jgi:defect-in-organelle-trafficking protein DotA